MKTAITKKELIALLAQGLADAEVAIRTHPDPMVAIYERGKAAFQKGAEQAQESEWSRAMGLTLPQLAVMHQYLLAMSFISAWYHIHGDTKRRNAATSPACLLVSGLGLKPEDVMLRYLEYERKWRDGMRASGLRRGVRPAILLAAVVAVAFLIWLLFR
ncbi:MAG: hypothetical protein ABIG44_18165 [Planctomycetota bacterium]